MSEYKKFLRSNRFKILLLLSLLVILYLSQAGLIVTHIRSARESVLKKDLQTMREAIDNYTLDKQQPPESLRQLVEARYLREIPADPITLRNDWVPNYGDIELSSGRHTNGLDDVHSASTKRAADGTSYNTW